MMKNLKNNKLLVLFYFALFFLVFSPQFFLSSEKNILKFGKKGSNFFFKKYSNNSELKLYLDDIYFDYKNLTTKELCIKLVHETYEIKKPIKKILYERNVIDCNIVF